MHAFEEAQNLHPRIRISHSQNLHELRAYNKVARLARSEVLIFAQDDDIPPPTPAWVDRLLLVFETLAAPPAALAAVGLFRGKTTMWHHRVEEEEEGWRNDVGTGLHACNATRYGHGPVAPITFAADLTLSPIAVRTDAFLALGGFNESYSEPGKPAMGLEHELTARLWEAGYAAAVACPTEASIFRRGCGLRGTWANKESVAARAYASYHNSVQFAAQFDERRSHAIEQTVRARNAWIRGGDAPEARALASAWTGCITSCAGINQVRKRQGPSSDRACETDDGTKRKKWRAEAEEAGYRVDASKAGSVGAIEQTTTEPRPDPPALPPPPCKLRYSATDGTWSQETSVDARQCVLRNLERDLAWWRTERSSRCNRPRSPDVDGTLCRVRAQDRRQVLTNMMLLRSSNGRLSARILLDPGDVRGPMRHWPARPIAALQQLSALQQRIDDGTLPPLPNFTAIINPADEPMQDARTDWCGLVPVLSNSRVSGENRDLMMPDFSFAPFSYLTNTIGANMSTTASVPRGWFVEREAIYRAGRHQPYQQKRRSLFWRGGQTHELRRVYSEAIASGRVKLQGGIDADVRLCGTGHCSLSDGVAPEAWCDHQQLLSLPGHSFAVGFKYTLLCSSLVVRGAYDPPVPCGQSACPKAYEQFWHAGLKDGEHFLTSHVVEDLPDAVKRADARPDASLIASRAADYAYTVLDPEFISEYWHALLAGYAGLFDWDDPELALAPAMCARQPRTRWLNQAERVCFRGARLGRCYMKLMGTTRDQDFVPIPSTQSMAEQCATTAGMQDLYRSFASVLPVRFAGGANVSEAARSALQTWKEGSFKKAPKNKHGR